MALLGGWLSSKGREERHVRNALNELSATKTPVRAEVEGAAISFFTVISIRKNGLLIARPRTLRGNLPKETAIRLTLPNSGRRQVRTQVMVGHITLPYSVKHAMVCTIPKEWSGRCQRLADRFATTRFKNLLLHVPSSRRAFRVIDMSSSGVRIYTGKNGAENLFEAGTDLGGGRLRVGERVVIELESLVPRGQTASAVGLEMKVARDPNSKRYLVNLLNRLAEQELRRLQIDSA